MLLVVGVRGVVRSRGRLVVGRGRGVVGSRGSVVHGGRCVVGSGFVVCRGRVVGGGLMVSWVSCPCFLNADFARYFKFWKNITQFFGAEQYLP